MHIILKWAILYNAYFYLRYFKYILYTYYSIFIFYIKTQIRLNTTQLKA